MWRWVTRRSCVGVHSPGDNALRLQRGEPTLGVGAGAAHVHHDDVGLGRVGSTISGSMRAIPVASLVARAWSSARRSTIWSNATSPAAASMPACRMPPPTMRRNARARSMNRPSHKGANRTARSDPCETQKARCQRAWRCAAAGTPSFTAALNSRAPSMCNGMPCSRGHGAQSLRQMSRGERRRRRRCCGSFRRRRGPSPSCWASLGLIISRTASTSGTPRLPRHGAVEQAGQRAMPPISLRRMWDSASSSTSPPPLPHAPATRRDSPWCRSVRTWPHSLPVQLGGTRFQAADGRVAVRARRRRGRRRAHGLVHGVGRLGDGVARRGRSCGLHGQSMEVS